MSSYYGIINIGYVKKMEGVKKRISKNILYTNVFSISNKYDCISILTRFDTSSL